MSPESQNRELPSEPSPSSSPSPAGGFQTGRNLAVTLSLMIAIPTIVVIGIVWGLSAIHVI